MPAGAASSAVLSGGSGIMPAGIRTGMRGASLELGSALAAMSAAFFGAASQEAWPDAEPWGRKSLWQKPWWNADRRARPQAEGRRKPIAPWRDPRAACVRDMKQCVCRRSASFFSFFVARMERSEIREQRQSVTIVPGLRSAPSGLRAV